MERLKLAFFAVAQGAWVVLRALGRAVFGARFDRFIELTGLRDLKNRVWIERRILPDGGEIFYRPQDACIVDEVYGRGVYAGTEIMPGQTVVDVGAHIGAFALMAARRVGPTGRVIAFEPSPRTLELLRRNLSANGLPWIAVHPVALAEKDGTAELFVADDVANNPAADTLTPAPGRRGVSVPIRRLDDVLAEDGVLSVDHLKIDVEGAELRVLDGASKTLARARRVVMEVHPPSVEVVAVRRRLETLGFSSRVASEAGGSVIVEASRR